MDIPFTEGFGQLYLPVYLQWAILLGIIAISVVVTYLSWRVTVPIWRSKSSSGPSSQKEASPRFGLDMRKYGLFHTTLAATVIKGSVFVIGILIIGVLEPRTILNACPSLAPPVAIYQFAPWSHVEAYTDYRDIYLPCLVASFLKGANLYHLYGVTYNYPPLFLYLISGFAYVANLIWLPAFPLVLFDVLTTIPVYLIARDFLFQRNARLAFIVSLVWAANPINLFYNDLMWLNTAPATFFLVLAIYLLLKQQWSLSSLALAVSTGFKQISVIFFPVLLIFLFKSVGFSKKLIAYVSIYILSLVMISTPYIFTEAQYYFWSLDFPILGIPVSAPNVQPLFSTSFSDPVRITTFLGYLSSSYGLFVTESYLYLNYFLIGSIIIVFIFLAIEPVRSFSRYSQWHVKTNLLRSEHGGSIESQNPFYNSIVRLSNMVSPERVLGFCLAIFLIFLTLYGGGVYKYYFAGITPLVIPVFKKKSGLVIFEALSIFLIFVPREISPWVAFVFLLLLPRIFRDL